MTQRASKESKLSHSPKFLKSLQASYDGYRKKGGIPLEEYRKLDKLLAQERKTQTKVTTAFIDKVRNGKI